MKKNGSKVKKKTASWIPHPTKGSTNLTGHCYLKLPIKVSETYKEALSCVVLYESESDIYFHPYFNQSRQIPTCVTNQMDNMSQTTAELFMMCRYMTNVQVLAHSNGTMKYICKYVSKFGDRNRIIVLFIKTKTGETLVRVEFLNNTKIASYNFNEEKALKQSRHKYHPVGRDMPILEILHLCLGLPEVTTNMWFIPICTYSFKIRSKHKIKIDKKGKVVR